MSAILASLLERPITGLGAPEPVVDGLGEEGLEGGLSLVVEQPRCRSGRLSVPGTRAFKTNIRIFSIMKRTLKRYCNASNYIDMDRV